MPVLDWTLLHTPANAMLVNNGGIVATHSGALLDDLSRRSEHTPRDIGKFVRHLLGNSPNLFQHFWIHICLVCIY